MAKYNLSSKSDMNKFKDDLEKQVLNTAKSRLKLMLYDVECPNCHKSVSVHSGRNVCPECAEEIHVNLNFDF